MSDFAIRSDHVDVEQIMRQIRARIREKRGVDYTEQEIRELAAIKLERFLDPRTLRSDLIERYRRQQAARPPRPLPPLPPPPENYAFEDHTLYDSHRAPLRWLRRLLNPILKLFFNPNPLIHVLHLQSKINEYHWRAFAEHVEHVNQRLMSRDELDVLHYEVAHNLVLELTRLGIEVRNLRMRLESLATRLDFDERRARALEGVVQYRPGPTGPDQTPREPGESADAAATAEAAASDVGRPGKRRRRRRSRRRIGGDGTGTPAEAAGDPTPEAGSGAADDEGGGGAEAGQGPSSASPSSPAEDDGP